MQPQESNEDTTPYIYREIAEAAFRAGFTEMQNARETLDRIANPETRNSVKLPERIGVFVTDSDEGEVKMLIPKDAE